MNSSTPSETKEAKPSAPARPQFNWIEFVAVPVATSIMETQSILVVLAFIAPIFGLNVGMVPLGEVGITLLFLGLQWWALMVKYWILRGVDVQQVRPLHILGLVIAAGTAVTLTAFDRSNLLALFLMVGLVLWFWKRSMDWARTGLSDEHIITAFRIGFCALLIELILAVLFVGAPLLSLLAHALPLFVLSGLIGLSFTRLGLIRKENTRNSPTGADPTRSWLAVLALLWIVIIVAALAFETFSFQSLVAIMPFFWNALGTLVTWIIYAIFFILSPLFALFGLGNSPFRVPNPLQAPPHKPGSPPKPPHMGQISPELLLLGRIVLLLVVLLIVVLVVRAILRRWHLAQEEEGEEEIREALPVQAILKNRRDERRKRKKEASFLPEALDATSARAYYRELLQSVAVSNEKLARHPQETPAEYEARLLTRVKSSAESGEEDVPSDAAILDSLTRAYGRERYGGKESESSLKRYLNTWVPHLMKRLTDDTR